jgi:hypothetical protein
MAPSNAANDDSPAGTQITLKAKRGSKGGRAKFVAARMSDPEYAVLDHKAREAGLSIGAYLRACALGDAGPRAQKRPHVNTELLSYAVTQLNRVGNNANQIAHRLNGVQPIASTAFAAVADEASAAIRQIIHILGLG